MSIFPLPVFESDGDPSNRSAMTDEEEYARLKAPTTIVVRMGRLRHVAEYPYKGDAKPGCGSKLIARTNRGNEVVEMLTSTCPNSGCGKSVSRKEMLEYIENSGGKDYPFRRDGEILRVATIEDLNRWSAIQGEAQEHMKTVRNRAESIGLEMTVIDVEPILSEDMLTVYYMAEERIDFRDLVKSLAETFRCRIEMKQVGARDEARITADYERCGQHCCCKNFLKVLKPVSMRSAKVQKATLDPLKISGRCGRLMCCLRYEDETYSDLKKKLPHRKSRVGTPEGPGIVIDSKILVQLVLVELDEDRRRIAVPVEELCDPDSCPEPGSPVESDPLRGMNIGTKDRSRNTDRSSKEQQDRHRAQSKLIDNDSDSESVETEPKKKKKRRRRRRKRKSGNPEGGGSPENN